MDFDCQRIKCSGRRESCSREFACDVRPAAPQLEFLLVVRIAGGKDGKRLRCCADIQGRSAVPRLLRLRQQHQRAYGTAWGEVRIFAIARRRASEDEGQRAGGLAGCSNNAPPLRVCTLPAVVSRHAAPAPTFPCPSFLAAGLLLTLSPLHRQSGLVCWSTWALTAVYRERWRWRSRRQSIAWKRRRRGRTILPEPGSRPRHEHHRRAERARAHHAGGRVRNWQRECALFSSHAALILPRLPLSFTSHLGRAHHHCITNKQQARKTGNPHGNANAPARYQTPLSHTSTSLPVTLSGLPPSCSAHANTSGSPSLAAHGQFTANHKLPSG